MPGNHECRRGERSCQRDLGGGGCLPSVFRYLGTCGNEPAVPWLSHLGKGFADVKSRRPLGLLLSHGRRWTASCEREPVSRHRPPRGPPSPAPRCRADVPSVGLMPTLRYATQCGLRTCWGEMPHKVTSCSPESPGLGLHDDGCGVIWVELSTGLWV